jgi:hypothetical protein
MSLASASPRKVPLSGRATVIVVLVSLVLSAAALPIAVPRRSEGSSESGERWREHMYGCLESAAIGGPEACALFVVFTVVFFVFVGLWLLFTMVVVAARSPAR